MLDRYLLPWQEAALAAPARFLCARGVSADTVTISGFAIGEIGAGLVALRHYELALGAILASRVLDGLDGVVARRQGATDRGAFLDIAFDFFFYSSVPFGFALANPAANALAASALLLSFAGTCSSFLAFAVIAAKRGLISNTFPKKGLYYLGGLTEGAETIVAFTAMCLWPSFFAPIAWAFAALAVLTTITRWLSASALLTERRP